MLKCSNEPHEAVASGLVEVITANGGGKQLGLRIGGKYAGPKVLVAGHDPLTGMVCNRLLRLPTTHWLRGTLTLVDLNAFDDAAVSYHFSAVTEGPPDELLFLPFVADAALQEVAVKEGYWSILRLCAKLGMISGRGIPSNTSI